jgi:AraC-like DNA-binding protein
VLANDVLSISGVVYKVGFASGAYFSTASKSKFSLTHQSIKNNREGNRVGIFCESHRHFANVNALIVPASSKICRQKRAIQFNRLDCDMVF